MANNQNETPAVVVGPVSRITIDAPKMPGDLSKLRLGMTYAVPTDRLSVDPTYNVRTLIIPAAGDKKPSDTAKRDKALLDLISRNGITQALTAYVDGDKLVVQAGHGRRDAALRLNIPFLPVTIIEKLSDRERYLDLQNSNSGRPLSTIAKARLALHLANLGDSLKDIAKQLSGVTDNAVRQFLYMARAPKPVVDAIEAERLAGSLVAKLCSEAVGELPKSRTEAEATAAAAAVYSLLTDVLQHDPSPTEKSVTAYKRKLAGLAPVVDDPNAVYTMNEERHIFAPGGTMVAIATKAESGKDLVRLLNSTLKTAEKAAADKAAADKVAADKVAADTAAAAEVEAPVAPVAMVAKRGRPTKRAA